MVEIWGKEKYIIKEGFIEKRIEKRKYLGENKKKRSTEQKQGEY